MAITIKKDLAQNIVESIKDVCEHDINFINTQGTIFASTNPTRIGDLHEIGRNAAQRRETIEVTEDNSFLGTQKGINIPFIYKGELAAVIGISGEPDEVRKFAYLAQKVTSLLLREQELDKQTHVQKTQLNQVIHSIIYNEYLNPYYLTEFLKKYHTQADSEYRTIIIKLDRRYNPSNFSLIEDRIYNAFAQTGSALYTYNYANEYILLLESSALEKSLYIFEQLIEKCRPLIKIGIGLSCEFVKQSKSYKSAQIALQGIFGTESLAIYDSLDLEILLGAIPQETKLFFLKQTLDELPDSERKLLRTYFSCDMSLKQTCDELYLHKNTLQYRLDKIWKLTGYNPRHFRDAVVLYMALRLDE